MNAIIDITQNISVLVTSIVTLASTITAITNTPSDTGIMGKIYKIIEFLALVTEKTKQK